MMGLVPLEGETKEFTCSRIVCMLTLSPPSLLHRPNLCIPLLCLSLTCEDIAKRQLSTSQELGIHKNLIMLASSPQTSSLQNFEKQMCAG